MKTIPTHDPQTGELNPYYKELTGKQNPLKQGDAGNKLTYRMYGLVPYNISPIQQGIQFGHAVVEYGLTQTQQDPVDTNLSPYNQWAHNDKTFVILDGGTTNTNPLSEGTLNQHLSDLKTFFNVKVATFYEPDLGDQLTAVVFLVDERVWDEETYPHYVGDDWQYVVDLRKFLSTFKIA